MRLNQSKCLLWYVFARTCVFSKKKFIIRVVKIVISFVFVNASNILVFRVLGLRSAIFCKMTSLFAIMALLTSSWARLYTIFVREFSPTVATGLGPSVVIWGIFLVIFISLITCIVIIMLLGRPVSIGRAPGSWKFSMSSHYSRRAYMVSPESFRPSLSRDLCIVEISICVSL